jgi:hypothetical protein
MTDRNGFNVRLIEQYREAFRAANGIPCPYTIIFERGWFKFREGNRTAGNHRRASVVRMIATLNARANA